MIFREDSIVKKKVNEIKKNKILFGVKAGEPSSDGP
jgi:hypothetical protein